jgi:hypothetical protein
MKQIPITIEGKNYQLFYAHVDGHLLTRLETSNDEMPLGETMPKGEVVHNLIFATMLFRNDDSLWKLKQLLYKAIKVYRDSGQKNRLYCLYAALWSVPGVLAKKEAPDFIRQLKLWFADDFPEEGTPEFDRLCDNLHKEARIWGGWKTPVKVNEWKSYALKKKDMNQGKINQFVSVAMEIFLPLNGLVKELRKKDFHSFH